MNLEPKPPNRRQAFGLIEALAAVVLLAVGIVATLSCLGAMSKAQWRALQSEKMERLAAEKYHELVATGALPTGSATGDFQDYGNLPFIWRADRNPVGSGNLDTLEVQVAQRDHEFGTGVEVTGLVCRQPAPTTSGTQPTPPPPTPGSPTSTPGTPGQLPGSPGSAPIPTSPPTGGTGQ